MCRLSLPGWRRTAKVLVLGTVSGRLSMSSKHMRDKKSEESDKSTEEKALEERVDAMMDPKRDGADKADKAVDADSDSGHIITVSVKSKQSAEPATPLTDQPTAPQLPGKLLKQLPKDEPLSIDKLDELTGGISEPASETSTANPETESTEFDDTATDEAVDDIVANEGDTVLALEDVRAARRNGAVKSAGGWKNKLRALLKSKWTWLSAAVLLLVIFGLPVTRYKLLGLVFKKPVTLTIIDSKTTTPVSNAQVLLSGKTGKTDANGQVHLEAPVGKGSLVITKQYYKTSRVSYFVGWRAAPPSKINLVATGRLVPISVVNKITGKPLQGVTIHVLKTTAKTDAKGMASIALPTSKVTDSAKLQLTGYNLLTADLQVTDKAVKANNFELTPAGHIYFLSNLNGSLDVVKANLDGSDRHTVLAGTGHEDKGSTSLLASRDWRYLVLKARRDGDHAALYLIDTSNDKYTEFDTGSAAVNLVGWYGHNFIYDLTRDGVSNWQTGRETLKSYDADNQQLNQLDQNQAEGDASSYAYQSFANFYIVNGAVVYNTEWYAPYSAGMSHDLSGKNNTIRAVQPSGQSKKDYQPLPSGTASYNRAALYEPNAVYFEAHNDSDNKTTYYAYEDQAVKPATGIDQTSFNQSYPTYLISPSGSQTFWTDLRDGKNTLFTGDADAKNSKQIASLSAYSPYGWYSDAYTLVSKNGSELYVMPASGTSTASRPPLKITDYYKPAQTYAGYGYGYGGL